MRKLSLILSIFALSISAAYAQNSFKQGREIGVVYNTEQTVDARFHTNGFAIGMNFGKIKTYYLTRFYHIGIGELKHHKEQRVNLDRPSVSTQISRSFIYGKQNNLYALRFGVGEKRMLSEAARKKGVAVGLTYQLGGSLGMLKPYYLELNRAPDFTSANTISTKYSPEVHDSFLRDWDIFGSSGWTKGLSEIQFRPGLQGQVAAHLDWGYAQEFVKAMEVGIMFDVFLGNTPIMVPVEGVENRPFFVNLFVNLQLGKRK